MKNKASHRYVTQVTEKTFAESVHLSAESKPIVFLKLWRLSGLSQLRISRIT